MAGSITVGSLLNPNLDDEQFSNIDKAMAVARLAARTDPHFAVAVWCGDELHRVLLRGFELVEADAGF